ncbi:MAG: excinuclease ABC subunit A [Candidatus Magasanikbacteria bacterium RIFCSPLOWO2_01_FULL_43_20b]|uniref:UvrABC system protein A n=1 Tax=Candidatus Magasanikbacteria bacterium RIFCSPLOWO2_12_FULL_43_12 TaxID=1798692 RepID=A0A1F6MVJ1_9BACT|nr:MAG: excinuclease ABC subunit A [Candidatus Magasanikbacteria bacterium RIFCSPLOWO2_02_FULL_43_22]OGH73041.1 MAG: excinuclease ABC subunit A [Candidatus Magasanikbacteria bacterium RIFCSPLOWO2_01_FULL_43_20b]OGH75510.1 MAG: excinuclease ABC subunit A [Candidatus Magasanikbacteria bacterium RIFCSPLOWO2_12_FULL_43_12]
MNSIKIINSRVHNLKNVSLEIPKNKLTVITGLSGSGKSSLAFDTIYAEGQRRYAESLSAYARRFMELQDRPDVDEIRGLSPTIAIDQRSVLQNPRSTVGTITEIYDHLRLLFARLGTQYCPECGIAVRAHSIGEIVEEVRKIGRRSNALLILSPLIQDGQIKLKELLSRLEQAGAEEARVNGMVMKLIEVSKFKFEPQKKYTVELLAGRVSDIKKQDFAAIVDKAIDLSNGDAVICDETEGEDYIFSTNAFCRQCGKRFDPIEPRSFSFNSPYGACPRCTGLGITLEVDPELVIPNPRLTLAEGAIQPWTRIVGNHGHYQKLLAEVARAHNFSLNTPAKDLTKDVMDVLFYGTDGEEYEVAGKKAQFEGIIPNLTQRHFETDSEYVRKEIEQYMHERVCSVCKGKRLRTESLFVKIDDHSVADLAEMSAEEAGLFFKTWLTAKKSASKQFSKNELMVAAPIIREIDKRLEDLLRVGLYYLSLDRSINTLSGGEAQRVRLSTQLSTGLTGVIYILDEPSVGLHPRDNDKLISTLKFLRDQDNTVIVVEHDKAMIEAADYVVDVGPGAGEYGGEIVASGTVGDIKRSAKSLTGRYLLGKETISAPKKHRKGSGKIISIIGAKAFNLKNIDVDIPLGKLVCVTGVSGSGKSTLISDILGKSLNKHFYRAKDEPAEHKKVVGLSNIDKVIVIDQTAIGRTPRSNPATYTGVFSAIRDVFTAVPEAKMRNYDAGKFSFNVKGGGRCEACAGEGYVRIPMQFLSDVFVECAECQGKRYNKEALEVHYHGRNIADVLGMAVEEACPFFRDVPAIADKLKILRDVGLGYVHLGQSATTLSGGEAQRVKLATELARRATGRTLYILDEPTTGLHFEDIRRLLEVLNQLVEKGNTVLIIEHNLDVIKCADWIIDLGPEGGRRGGEIVAQGTPADVAKVKRSYTGQYLKRLLN